MEANGRRICGRRICVWVLKCVCVLGIEDIGSLMIERKKILSQSVSGFCALGSGVSALRSGI